MDQKLLGPPAAPGLREKILIGSPAAAAASRATFYIFSSQSFQTGCSQVVFRQCINASVVYITCGTRIMHYGCCCTIF
jgi:hypothetical protein